METNPSCFGSFCHHHHRPPPAATATYCKINESCYNVSYSIHHKLKRNVGIYVSVDYVTFTQKKKSICTFSNTALLMHSCDHNKPHIIRMTKILKKHDRKHIFMMRANPTVNARETVHHASCARVSKFKSELLP